MRTTYYSNRRGGHCPGHVRDTFLNAVEAFGTWNDGEPEFLVDLAEISVILLMGEAILREHVTKTEHSHREITVPAPIIALLRRHKAEQAEHALQWGTEYHRLGLVFPDRDGLPMRPNRMTDHLRGLMKIAGVAKGKQPAHAWRHLSATILLHAGEDLKTVSRRLGHSSPVTTLAIYSHTDKEKDAGASEVIGKALAGLMKPTNEAGK